MSAIYLLSQFITMKSLKNKAFAIERLLSESSESFALRKTLITHRIQSIFRTKNVFICISPKKWSCSNLIQNRIIGNIPEISFVSSLYEKFRKENECISNDVIQICNHLNDFLKRKQISE